MQRSAALRVLAGAFASSLAGCGDPVSCVAIPQAIGSPSTPTAFGSTVYHADDAQRVATLVADCGGALLRAQASPIDDFMDALFAAASQRGMRVIMLSPYATQPVDINAYASNCAFIHARYAQYNPIWEIWNEPNLAYYWGAEPNVVQYTKLAIATGQALRAAGATDIWSGGTSGIHADWTLQMRRLGAFSVLNGCAVHTYSPAACMGYNDYLQVLSVLPPGVQVHTTETCLPSIEDQVGFLQQTWFIHRTLGLPTMIWCELRDGDAGHGGEYTLPYGLVTTDYSLKPVYYAAKSLTSATPGFRPQRRV